MIQPLNPAATAIGLSGLQAARLRLDSSSHNVANLQTPDFRRQAVSQTAGPGQGGVDARITLEVEAPGPGVDGLGRLAEDLLQQRLAVYSFEANLRTLQTQDRMLGALLDARA